MLEYDIFIQYCLEYNTCTYIYMYVLKNVITLQFAAVSRWTEDKIYDFIVYLYVISSHTLAEAMFESFCPSHAKKIRELF